MDAAKSAWLTKVAGADLAQGIISKADEATKNLEGSVAFKENADLTAALETVKGLVEDAPDEVKTAYADFLSAFVAQKPAETTEETKETVPSTPAFDEASLLAKIGDLVKPAVESATSAAEAATATTNELKALSDRVKSLEDDATEKANRDQPRGASMFRATAAATNHVDPEKAKDLNGTEPPPSPVAGYVSDVMTGKVPVSA